MRGGGTPRKTNRRNPYEFLPDNLTGKHRLINLGVDSKIILQRMLNRLHIFGLFSVVLYIMIGVKMNK